MNEAKEIRHQRRQLEEKHHLMAKEYQSLKDRVKRFGERRFLNEGDTLEYRTLQRMKLFKKDALTTLETELQQSDLALKGFAATEA